MSTEWFGHLDRGTYATDLEESTDRLADAARIADWATVQREAEHAPNGINSWRFGGTSWFTSLHQAAYLGAPESVVTELLALGAWKSLRTANGDTAADIAAARGHTHLRELLTVPIPQQPATGRTEQLDAHLEQVMRDVLRGYGITPNYRFPSTSVLAESYEPLKRPELWCSVAGMYGGFHITMISSGLRVQSWSRGSTGSGLEHWVTPDGSFLTDEGFI